MIPANLLKKLAEKWPDLTGTGRLAYIWVGNETGLGASCYGHVSGQTRLRNFAKTILKTIPPRKKKVK